MSLSNLLILPLGLTFVVGVIKLYELLLNKFNTIWYLLSLLALVASFNVFKDPFDRIIPDLVFPLQLFKQNGRLISAGILIVILIVLFLHKNQYQFKLKDVYGIKNALLFIHFLVFLKNFIYGNLTTAITTFVLLILMLTVFYKGVPMWLKNESSFKVSVFAFLVAVFLFNGMSLYQSLFDPSALILFNGRFMGMTGNPLHAAVLLASGVPILLVFLIEVKQRWQKVCLIIGLLLNLYYLTLTGSRTGMLMVVISAFIFLVGFKVAGLKLIVTASILFFLFFTFTEFNPFKNDDQDVLSRYSSTENSREQVIAIQLRQFSENPLFGMKPRGDRLGFAENSYLAVAASLGIVGLIPLYWILRGLFKMVLNLWKKAKFSRNRHFYYLVISGIISLLIGAFLEAYLLGNLTWPIILLLCYVHWGYYLLQKDIPVIVK